MSMENKLKLVQMVDRRSLLPNEWRQVMNLAPLEGGDEPLYWQNPKLSEKEREKDDQQGQDLSEL